jgi:hypothetical protein
MKNVNLQRVFFWNRKPGVFVNKTNGQQIQLEGLSIGPMFTGSVQEWYETLVETIIDMRNTLEKEARCKADRVTVTCDPDVFCMLNCSVLFHPSEDDRNSGTLSQMKVFAERSQPRFQLTVEIEYKIGGRTQSKAGRVHVLED